MSTNKIILAGTLLGAATEAVLKDRLIRLRGEIIESVEPMPATPPETSPETPVIDAPRQGGDARPGERPLPPYRGFTAEPPGPGALRAVAPGKARHRGHPWTRATTTCWRRTTSRCWKTSSTAPPPCCITSRGAGPSICRKSGRASTRPRASGFARSSHPSIADVGWRRVVPAEEASAAAREELRRLGEALDLVADGPATVKGAVAPSSPHTCTDDFLSRCLAMAEERDLLMHTHFLETRVEAMQRTAAGETTVERASRLGLLRPETSLAHAVHLSHRELDVLAEKQAAVVHNPCSNAKLGSGIARIREMLDRGITVALGSDGGDTSDGYSMFDQMKMAAVMRRCSVPDFNTWITAAESLAMATTGGAKALGLKAGSIAPGHLADICILKPTH